MGLGGGEMRGCWSLGEKSGLGIWVRNELIGQVEGMWAGGGAPGPGDGVK